MWVLTFESNAIGTLRVNERLVKMLALPRFNVKYNDNNIVMLLRLNRPPLPSNLVNKLYFCFCLHTLNILVIKQNKPLKPRLGYTQSDICNWVKPERKYWLDRLLLGVEEKFQQFLRRVWILKTLTILNTTNTPSPVPFLMEWLAQGDSALFPLQLLGAFLDQHVLWVS